ncbi:DUF6518 family protein [Streptomyces sp. NPDC057433]|uniref:DUF6518 family protein n=1 Tax=Streptomyces sp. NPDC057433 TaxID=3346132 RepID=UPI00369FAA70
MATTDAPEKPAEPSSATSGRSAALAAAAAGGLLLGVLTNLAQGWLPGAWNQLANSGAIWSASAFVAGALLARRNTLLQAAVGGLVAEAGLVVGYYGYAEFGREGMGSPIFPLIWLAMACAAGPLFGVAGQWWRCGKDARRRVVGLAALAGLFGMEGVMYAWDLHYTPQAVACFAVFALIPPVMARTHQERALTLATAVPCALLAYSIVILPLQAVSS